MLEIFNYLKPFFEDCYKELGVREYSRILKISPPTASFKLKGYVKEGLLKSEKNRNYLFFRANRENNLFIGVSKLYWGYKLSKIGLIDFLDKKYNYPVIILYGSLVKGEAKFDSDVDLAIIGSSDKKIDLAKLEKILRREIHIFVFGSLNKVKNKNLLDNILNGEVLSGKLRL